MIYSKLLLKCTWQYNGGTGYRLPITVGKYYVGIRDDIHGSYWIITDNGKIDDYSGLYFTVMPLDDIEMLLYT